MRELQFWRDQRPLYANYCGPIHLGKLYVAPGKYCFQTKLYDLQVKHNFTDIDASGLHVRTLFSGTFVFFVFLSQFYYNRIYRLTLKSVKVEIV